MEIRLGIRDTDRLCRAQTELVASQIKKACPEVTFTRRELAGYIGGSEEDEHWITDVVNAISQGRIDMGVVSMKKLMKAESSVIWNRGINLTAITRRRDARTVLITRQKVVCHGEKARQEKQLCYIHLQWILRNVVLMCMQTQSVCMITVLMTA